MFKSFKAGTPIANPFRPSMDPEICTMRTALKNNELILCADPTKIHLISPKTKIIKIFPPEQRAGICHKQSISMLLGIEENFFEHFTMTGNTPDTNNIDISLYCDYVATPQKNDFVAYLDLPLHNGKFTGETTYLFHTAMYAGNGRAISKFRVIPALFEHDLDEVPANYFEKSSNPTILFFRKKIGIDLLKEVKIRLNHEEIKQKLQDMYISVKQEMFELVTCVTQSLPEHVLKLLKNSSQHYRTVEPFELYTALQGHPGLNINETNEEGETLLTVSIRAHNQKAMHLLIESGINIKTHNKRGLTPLMIAAINNNLDAMATLIKHGVDLDATDNEGHTTLSLLAARHKAEQLLISYGAHTTIPNNLGSSDEFNKK